MTYCTYRMLNSIKPERDETFINPIYERKIALRPTKIRLGTINSTRIEGRRGGTEYLT